LEWGEGLGVPGQVSPTQLGVGLTCPGTLSSTPPLSFQKIQKGNSKKSESKKIRWLNNVGQYKLEPK
jgi:hypothetical protein